MAAPDSGTDLPVAALIAPLTAALAGGGRALVEAPPGAGKSTVLPLHLGAEATPDRRLILIQPRRLAAGAVAQQLARRLGEPVGGRVGLRTRFDRQVSARTAIEVVTEGIFLRTIQRDPELSGIGWVLFDEFHERSWQADLGLAFAIESQRDWRSEALRLVVMSATLPGAELQQWFSAPLLQAEGRRYPVEIDYAPPGRAEWTAHTAVQVRAALAAGARKVLVFLPGWGAMQRVVRQLGTLDAALHLLHSSVPRERQDAALVAPAAGEQAVVLATNIAETSLTIEGVDVVIDSGRVRRPSFDPGRGMDRLEEGWISLASAEQRAGRAGRLGPGRCIRLWDSERQRRLQRYDVPEVRVVDPAPIALELAVWGGEPALLDTPEPARRAEAIRSLQLLDALDGAGRITAIGRQMAQLGLHPRLARLVLEGREQGCAWLACAIAALVSEGDFLPRDAASDLSLRLEALRRGEPGTGDRGAFNRVRRLADQLLGRGNAAVRGDTAEKLAEVGALLARAWPDRLARRRDGEAPRFLTVAGFEVVVPAHDSLAHHEWIVALEHDGAREGARLQLGVAVSAAVVAEYSSARATLVESCGWDGVRNQIVAQRERRLGAVVLERTQGQIEPAAAQAIWRQQIETNGLTWLGWGERCDQWLARLRWLARRMPAASWAARFEEAMLLAELDEWLLPWLAECRRLDDLRRLDIHGLLRARLSYAEAQQLEELVPVQWQLPSGRPHAINYASGQPRLAARLTEFYGLDVHPVIAGEPLLLELLSPAGRPLQITGDLPGFWRGAYAEVRKEMKGRYPKHFWPEQPWCAPATATTKRHMPAGSQ